MKHVFRLTPAAALVLSCAAIAQNDFEIQPPPGGSVRIGPNTMPNNTGTSGQILTTDGAGNTAWTAPAVVEDTNELPDVEGPEISFSDTEECLDSQSVPRSCLTASLSDPDGIAFIRFLFFDEGTGSRRRGWWVQSTDGTLAFPDRETEISYPIGPISTALNTSKQLGIAATDYSGNTSMKTVSVDGRMTAFVPGDYALSSVVTIETQPCPSRPSSQVTFDSTQIRVSESSPFPQLNLTLFRRTVFEGGGESLSQFVTFKLADDTAVSASEETITGQFSGGGVTGRTSVARSISYTPNTSEFEASITYICEIRDNTTFEFSVTDTTGPFILNGTLID